MAPIRFTLVRLPPYVRAGALVPALIEIGPLSACAFIGPLIKGRRWFVWLPLGGPSSFKVRPRSRRSRARDLFGPPARRAGADPQHGAGHKTMSLLAGARGGSAGCRRLVSTCPRQPEDRGPLGREGASECLHTRPPLGSGRRPPSSRRIKFKDQLGGDIDNN